MSKKSSKRQKSKKRVSSKGKKSKTIIYPSGEIVAILGQEAPDYVYLYLIKENIYSLDTPLITTNVLRKVETTKKGHYFKIGQKISIG